MDLELDLDDDLLAAVQRAAKSAGITAEEWARRAIMSHIGVAPGPIPRRPSAEVADLEQVTMRPPAGDR